MYYFKDERHHKGDKVLKYKINKMKEKAKLLIQFISWLKVPAQWLALWKKGKLMKGHYLGRNKFVW